LCISGAAFGGMSLPGVAYPMYGAMPKWSVWAEKENVMAFENKSPEMVEMLQRMADAMGIPGPKAATMKCCALCGQNAWEFKDELSKKEYGISGMCQKCQDKVFEE
jgi:hypothetical protein